jgi:3,4-dihydroxy 2-butanone 4-phosphate synthase / GTP cyclohydrolase II
MPEDLIVQRAVCARVPTAVGEFQLCLYKNNHDEKEHLALINGDIEGQSSVLVRIHSECFTGDVLGSQRCDCGEQLRRAMELIALEGRGVIVYLRQEGRGIGLAEKLRAYNLQDDGLDTVDANLALGHPVDDRDYSMAAEILKDLGVKSARLITNNPQKITEMGRRGIEVVDRIALMPTVYADNAAYLLTKIRRMNHLFNLGIFSFSSLGSANGDH